MKNGEFSPSQFGTYQNKLMNSTQQAHVLGNIQIRS